MSTELMAKVLELLKRPVNTEAELEGRSAQASALIAELGLGQLNHYQVLGLGPNADLEAIEKAYKQLVRRWHPDLHQGHPAADVFFQHVVKAYQVLSDAETRVRYDAGATVGREETGHRSFDLGLRATDNPAWGVTLVQAAALLTNCSALFYSGGRGATIIGQPTNSRVCEVLYRWLKEQADHLCHATYRAQYPPLEAYYPGIEQLADNEKKWANYFGQWERIPKGAKPPPPNTLTTRVIKATPFRRAFMAGLANRLHQRAYAERRGMIERCVALVAQTDEQAAYAQRVWGKMKTLRTNLGSLNRQALRQGDAAADQVSLSAPS